jgi:selenide,water dikinase
MTAPEDARVALLTDPQTCGGLLAAVPGDLADALIVALRAEGHDAAVIGEVTAAAPHLTIV